MPLGTKIFTLGLETLGDVGALGANSQRLVGLRPGAIASWAVGRNFEIGERILVGVHDAGRDGRLHGKGGILHCEMVSVVASGRY